MSHQVTIRYVDGAERCIPVEASQTVLEAAEANGVPIVSECQSGICGTCVGRCTRGTYVLGYAIGLSQQEKEQRRVLTCQTRVESDCVIEVDYPVGDNAARIVSGEVSAARIERLSPDTALLVVDASSLPEVPVFKAGQFAQLKVPGTDQWRSYSFAHAPRVTAEVDFLIRLLPTGVMSDYLRERARPGDRLGFRGSKGGFFLRDATRPVRLIAGGTGVSAILAIAEQLVQRRPAPPIRLDYGVRDAADLVLVPRLERLASRHDGFTWRSIVQSPSPGWSGRVGLVTDLLEDGDLHAGSDVYACGPPAMIDATRRRLQERGLGGINLYYEKFLPSGTRASDASSHRAAEPIDLRAVREQGRGTAVVIGGSIAGMATAKVLTGSFARVIVLEKDQAHRRKEGRPGAAQGWHLHHLLIAGQRLLSSIFPGIIDDMVAAGAFRVDMGEQYRIMLAGSWKKVGRSGVEIVCAGRPLLEWSVRRRLDAEPAIDYRYESEVTDLAFDPSARSVVGVVVARDGRQETIPAEFVVDAAGKNTPVPSMLGRLGIGAPEIEEDCLNCFYSTMQHRVPPERAWRDKVMVICYAQRPQQQHYAAQYFTDSSRTVLSTSLVGYNCYRPPRNAEEFREFARLMPSHVIGSEIDGLEPCSPVYNFRYPEMRRFHYETLQDLPTGLVAVGDAFCSADPVSGAGMTKSLLELNELRTLLRERRARDHDFVRSYYASVARIADRVWSVIREQNLRYPWIKDVERKRPFSFRLQNWYVDRVFELLHDDPQIYRLYLLVTHFVEPSAILMRPRVMTRVLGRWLRTRLTARQSLIERNFGEGRMGEWSATLP
jgi:NAD(P)H-flavin reductase/2-polyprenyl-6-methoxyphenol hydroxylase-like FAD-dependent oxidoreductase/ferredoxin